MQIPAIEKRTRQTFAWHFTEQSCINYSCYCFRLMEWPRGFEEDNLWNLKKVDNFANKSKIFQTQPTPVSEIVSGKINQISLEGKGNHLDRKIVKNFALYENCEKYCIWYYINSKKYFVCCLETVCHQIGRRVRN